jgi:SAM-dependent methyltransferase
MERTYGPLYGRLTSSVLEELDVHLDGPASIVDFGAGCGRLTLPLASAGHRVVAVEPSAGMRTQLREQVARLPGTASQRVRILGSRMRDVVEQNHDVALCVFTVLAYILDEEELEASLSAAARSLRRGGLFLLDVPSESLFQSFDHDDAIMIRHVEIEPLDAFRYTYREHTTLRTPGGIVSYEDAFALRRWSTDQILSGLRRSGFRQRADVSERFEGLGAEYLLMERT